jgi:hypothetical protein
MKVKKVKVTRDHAEILALMDEMQPGLSDEFFRSFKVSSITIELARQGFSEPMQIELHPQNAKSFMRLLGEKGIWPR